MILYALIFMIGWFTPFTDEAGVWFALLCGIGWIVKMTRGELFLIQCSVQGEFFLPMTLNSSSGNFCSR